ncbi:MAG TPA: BrnA antitoxin family protein [Coxiellaceae bacterium]|nr:BrnA antitoxin family protein [Coxiellaceae bacterium]
MKKKKPKKTTKMRKRLKLSERPLTNKEGEVRELTAEDIRKMRPMEEVLSPEMVEMIRNRKVGQRGPQKKPTKISVTMRYSPEVVVYFKSTGNGWQTRMDEALKDWIKKHKSAA